MEDIEKLGLFYLGKMIDPKTQKTKDDLLLIESKHLTTHAVCVGMTGSGKTGLGITILEEAAIDKIPAIIIDPKGDLADLLLMFPNLSPEDFLPWVDASEAEKLAVNLKDYAASVAASWKEGLEAWGEGKERIQKLRDSTEIALYTPASTAGLQLSILNSFACPPKELLLDPGAIREKILSTVSGILNLVGIDADPIKSREHILISSILTRAWNQGEDLDIAGIIQQIQKPPFEKIGALDIDTFFSTKDRMALSIALNNLLASPGFQVWMEGEPLNIQNILYTPEGKPKLAIISIAHLSDRERMFFVTLLLNEFLAWTRLQPGTSSLRALLYMDEVAGYFPPVAMPPSKPPMITLLKQARAFGVGIVLCTQNPVDLDYKGLSNCGIWFIGKLQTERDRARVIEGLAVASNGEMNIKELGTLLGSIRNRTFLMRSVYEKAPILFQTRWTLSYLRGPLTLSQIAKLVNKPAQAKLTNGEIKSSISNKKPVVGSGIAEYFINPDNVSHPVKYKPYALGIAKLHYVDSKSNVSLWDQVGLIVPLKSDDKELQWETGKSSSKFEKGNTSPSPIPNSSFEDYPSILFSDKNVVKLKKSLADYLFQHQTFDIFTSSTQNLTSSQDESESDFRIRVMQAAREKRDEAFQKVREKYEKEISTLSEKVKRAKEKVDQKQSKSGIKKIETLIDVGTTLLGTLFGRGVTKGTINTAGTTMRRVGRMGHESQSTASSEQDYANYQQQLSDLQQKMKADLDRLAVSLNPQDIKLEKMSISPRKADIDVREIALVWNGEVESH